MHAADDGHTLSVKQEELCSQNQWDFSNLNALFLNCTLKPTPELSHTEGLTRIAITIMEKAGVRTESLRPEDYELAPGVYPDMRERGAERDDWPAIYKEVKKADILVLGSPIWLGEKSSVCTKVVERLYSSSPPSCTNPS